MNFKSITRTVAVVAAVFSLQVARAEAPNDIVAVASGAGQFNTLVAAVKAAGLVETLQGKGPFTVFAPTDAAFAKLDKKLVAGLLEPKNKGKLAAIIAYHVLPGRVLAKQVPETRTGVTTLNASEAKVFVQRHGAVVRVNGVRVITPDVIADKSVIHVINTVLWPGEIKG